MLPIVAVVLFVTGRAKEAVRADWKAEAVLAHEIANRVVAWDNFIVDAFVYVTMTTLDAIRNPGVFFAGDQEL